MPDGSSDAERHDPLEYDGPVAIVSNNRPDKHNAANDEMDARLWEILAELHAKRRACAASSGAATASRSRRAATPSELGVRTEDITDLEFIERGHRGTQLFFSMPCPIVVALKGWVIGGSFERALLCDLRIAGESARMRLPEVAARRRARLGRHRAPLPDGGPRPRRGSRADGPRDGRAGGAASRRRVARRARREARRDLPRDRARDRQGARLHRARCSGARCAGSRTRSCSASLQEEALTQSLVFASRDYAEMKAARAEKREPKYRGR